MMFLPVVERELRVAARRRAAFWTRVLAALTATGLGAWSLWFETDGSGAAGVGQGLFGTLTVAAFLFCLVAGPVFTADSLSQESRDGTLGLLFLTDLRSLDVVLGKLAAASVTAVFSLLAILPVLAIPLLLGGVALDEFGRVALVLVNTLLFSLAIGMAMSSLCEQAGSAVALTIFALFLLTLVLPAMVFDSLNLMTISSVGGVVAALLSPVVAFAHTSSADPNRDAFVFWLSVAGVQGIAWIALMFAAWRARSGFSGEPAGGPGGRWRRTWHACVYGAKEARRRRRMALLDRNPFLWLAGRHELKRQILAGFVCLAVGFWLVLRLAFGPEWWSWETSCFAAICLVAPLKLLMASEASARWSEDRRSGALELILTTSLGVEDLIRGHHLALRRLFGFPVAVVIVMLTLVLFLGWGTSGRDVSAGYLLMVNAIVFVWDLHALAWVGTWQGMIRHKPGRAATATINRILLLPWLLLFLAVFLGGEGALRVLPWLWLAICGAVNLVFSRLAAGDLRGSIREVVAGQFAGGRASGAA